MRGSRMTRIYFLLTLVCLQQASTNAFWGFFSKDSDVGQNSLLDEHSEDSDVALNSLLHKHSEDANVGHNSLLNEHSGILDVGHNSLLSEHSKNLDLEANSLIDEPSIDLDEEINSLVPQFSEDLDIKTKTLAGDSEDLDVVMNSLLGDSSTHAKFAKTSLLDENSRDLDSELYPVVIVEERPVAAAAPPFDWDSIRLPRNLVPHDYVITIEPEFDVKTFKGHVQIFFKVADADTHCIILHKEKLTTTGYSVNQIARDGAKTAIPVHEDKFFAPWDQLYIGVEKPLRKGQEYELHMDFHGKLEEGLDGLYMSKYTKPDGTISYLATTHFEATKARLAFPCFDEPDMKAVFNIRVIRDTTRNSISNAQLIKSENTIDGKVMDTFDATPKMSTYLVAFVVSDFVSISQVTERRDNSPGVKVRVYTSPHQIQHATFALSEAVKMLEFYEGFFGINFPLSKLDVIAIPDFSAGAMENWGLITYRESNLLYDPKETSVSSKQRVSVVIAHELAHQWFGNLVTMKWWNDLWLNEGFATFMEYVCTATVHPTWKVDDQFNTDILHIALTADSLSSSHPISNKEVVTKDQISSMFDSISYNKGSSILRMLGTYISIDELQLGLKYYLNTFNYTNAATADLWISIGTEVARTSKQIKDVNIQTLMDTWVKQVGFPIVNIGLHGKTLTAQQKQFVMAVDKPDSNAVVNKQLWFIPVTCRDSSGKLFNFILDSTYMSKTLQSKAKWMKCNVGQRGFYRVNYSTEMWSELYNTLQADINSLPSADIASLIDDAFALTGTGDVSIDLAMKLTLLLDEAPDYIVWATALSHLNTIDSMTSQHPANQGLQVYIRNMLTTMYNKLHFNSTQHYTQLLEGLIFSSCVKYGVSGAVAKALAMFNSWKIDGAVIPITLRKAVYTAGVKYGGEVEFNACWDRFRSTTNPAESRELMTALAQTNNMKLLQRYLDATLDTKLIRSQDFYMVYASVTSPAGLKLAWKMLKQHYSEYVKLYAGIAGHAGNLVGFVVKNFNTQQDHDDVVDFFTKADAGFSKKQISNSLNSVRIHIWWNKHHADNLQHWLHNHTQTYNIKQI